MAFRTRFTELAGTEWPVQLAAMGGGVGGTELASAVQGCGGLGMVSWTDELPDAGCGINFLVPFLPESEEVVAVARRTRVVEFFYGAPDGELVDLVHRAGPVVGWQVGSAAEAEAATLAGCDYVVAQGTEAGGHVRGTQPLDVVLSEVLARVSLPVVAAGGIATPERVAELVGSGVDAVRIGTHFLACPESNAHDDYVHNLLSAAGDETVLTQWFDLGWPDAPHRVLRSALEAARRTGNRLPVPPCRGQTQPAGDMAQYAGTGVGHLTTVRPASQVLAELVSLLDSP